MLGANIITGISYKNQNRYAVALITNATMDSGTSNGIEARISDQSKPAVLQINKAGDGNSPYKAIPILHANGGAWDGSVTYRTPTIDPTGVINWTKENTPIRKGYIFTTWSEDKSGQHPWTGTVITGQHLYAQWEKAAGKPSKLDLDCSSGGRCELTVNYKNGSARTREFTPGSNDLSWYTDDSAIEGVLLDASGYDADGACSDARCWYVSLKDAPDDSTSYQAQMPTTGAPEGLSSYGVAAVGLGLIGVSIGLMRRRS